MNSLPVVMGEIYHVYSKSIADYKIFNNGFEYSRMLDLVEYYNAEKPVVRFSRFKTRNMQLDICNIKKLVQIVCYCIMPTHIHLVLKQLEEKGISVFMSNTLNSYTRYFNIKHGRKGPLWGSCFKKVLVESDEQLEYLTRYVHLNPATACIVNKPEHWEWSSYGNYIKGSESSICEYKNLINVKPGEYKKFTEDGIEYQRELARIKNLILE